MKSSSKRVVLVGLVMLTAMASGVWARDAYAPDPDALLLASAGQFQLGNGDAKVIANRSVAQRYRICVKDNSLAVPVKVTADGVNTTVATGVTNGEATLNGSADPNLDATTGWFRYSTVHPGTCDDSFGTKAPGSGTALGSGTTAVSYSQPLSGLTANTTYYFCAIGQNSIAKRFGAVLSFTTTDAPAVTTSAATSRPTASAASTPTD